MSLLITFSIFLILFWYIISISREVIIISKLRVFKRKIKNKDYVFIIQKKFLGLFWISAIDTENYGKRKLIFSDKEYADNYIKNHNKIKIKNIKFF
jgi:hypothetical protein